MFDIMVTLYDHHYVRNVSVGNFIYFDVEFPIKGVQKLTFHKYNMIDLVKLNISTSGFLGLVFC